MRIKDLFTKKTFKTAAWGALVLLAVILGYLFIGLSSKPERMEWGITFSKSYAESLGLNWKETYLALLDDLHVDNIRLPAYWNEIEKEDNSLDFSDFDFMVDEASRRDVKIMLAVGRRLPRWPECHVPLWAKNLPEKEQQDKILEFLPWVISRYNNNPHVVMWQVENEFFLRGFGECPPADKKFFDRELALVRSLDTRPVVTTDSGELGGWIGSMRRGDIFGTTMYRIVYNKYIGYATYPLRAIYYKRRFLLYAPFTRASQIINVELQAEPWAITHLSTEPLEIQARTFNPEQFRKNIAYARASGISPVYLWGAEWWYYMKKIHNQNEIWEIAKSLWSE